MKNRNDVPFSIDNILTNNLRNQLKHGMTRTYFYRVWCQMKERCNNKNHKAYKNYGGRGIFVCDRWMDFNNFKADMFEDYLKHIEEHGQKQTSLDRSDNDKDYSPENCRWATRKAQSLNRRPAKTNNRLTVAKLCELHNLNQKTYWNRRMSGLDHIAALTKPVRKRGVAN